MVVIVGGNYDSHQNINAGKEHGRTDATSQWSYEMIMIVMT